MKKIDNHLNSNISIDKLIYSEESTERRYLIKKSKDLSSEKVMSQFEDISKLSEVKSKEKFKYKVIGIKNNRLKERLNNLYNESIDDNKDYKLSDLLDFTNINQKNNNKYQEKNDINNNEEEEFKDNKIDNTENESKKVMIDSVSDTIN